MKTPTSSRANPICEGFVIELGGATGKGKTDVATARKVVKEVLGDGWTVGRLAPKCPEFEVLRKDDKAVPIGKSWDLLTTLRKHEAVRSADQAMIIPGGDPAIGQVQPKKKALQAKGKKKAKHKPCSVPPEWSLKTVRAVEAWAMNPKSGGAKFGKGIRVGHPDTGYTKHPEIFANGQVLATLGYDFEDDKKDPVQPLKSGDTSHGTATASVIMSPKGKQTSSGTGWVSGVAPAAQLVPFRVSDSVVHIGFRNVAKAIRLAADRGCHVISMSLGGPIGYGYLERAVDYAIGKGVIVLAAAGNVWPFVVYPAKFSQVIGVAASNCRETKWSGSASGRKVDMTAPGESVWRALTRGKPSKFSAERSSGTSYAVATTAGACALWLAFHGQKKLLNKYGAPRLAAVFQSLLKSKGVRRPAGWDTKKMGTGILDTKRLLAAELPAAGALPKSLKAKSASALTAIGEYLPDFDRKRLGMAVDKVFGVKGKALTAAQEEIVFHLATNPELRAALEKAARTPVVAKGATKGVKAKTKALSVPGGAKILRDNPRLKRYASKALKTYLEGK